MKKSLPKSLNGQDGVHVDRDALRKRACMVTAATQKQKPVATSLLSGWISAWMKEKRYEEYGLGQGDFADENRVHERLDTIANRVETEIERVYDRYETDEKCRVYPAQIARRLLRSEVHPECLGKDGDYLVDGPCRFQDLPLRLISVELTLGYLMSLNYSLADAELCSIARRVTIAMLNHATHPQGLC